MAQGKFKLKGKNQKKNTQKKNKKTNVSRKPQPIAPKKTKFEESKKLKKIITKNVNQCIEHELRSIANTSSKITSKKEKIPKPTATPDQQSK